MDPDGNGYPGASWANRSPNPSPVKRASGSLDDKGIPTTIEGYQRLNAFLAATDQNLTEILFGEEGKPSRSAPQQKPRSCCRLYVYDPEAGCDDQPGDRDRLSKPAGHIYFP